MSEKLDIVLRLRRIVDKSRTAMPPVGVETLLEAADEIDRLRRSDAVQARATMLRYQDRCLNMAAVIHALVHGRRPDGSSIARITATEEAKAILEQRA